MARRKRLEESEDTSRWLVPYADFVTLLFAFFVVMYSISSVNEGKYRVLSNSLLSAFGKPVRSVSPIQIGSPVSPNEVTTDSFRVPSDLLAYNLNTSQKSGIGAEMLGLLAENIQSKMKFFIDQNMVSVTQKTISLEIEINTKILFQSGSAVLQDQARAPLRTIAGLLKGFSNQLQVEGFTDNRSIKTIEYPSNWELSSARAASVVHLFMDEGIRPERMSAIGYGQYRPVVKNDTKENRSKNRRVVVVVLADQTGPYGSDVK